jgi:HK97 family phage major capsid protein
MKKSYPLVNDGGTPELSEEEKKAIIDDFTTKAKADIMKDMQEEVNKIAKLIADERKAHEDLLKGRLSEADFKAYQEKSHTEEEAIKARLDELETKMDRPPAAPGPGEDKGDKERPEEVKAFLKYVRYDTKGMEPDELKVMKVSDDVEGGYTAPIEISSQVIKKLETLSKIRQIADVINIGGPGIEFPKEGDDTVTVAWDDETLVAGDYKFKMEKWEPKNLRALVTPHKNLLRDSMFNIEQYIVDKTAEKYNKKEGPAFISGPGTPSRPEGMLTHPDVQIQISGDASALTSDGVIKLFYKLPEAYVSNSRFLMKRSTVMAIRLFKDENNQYIWQPSYQAGQPEMLLGKPIVEDPNMGDVAADAYPIIFGDFKQAYLIVDRQQIEMQRLIEKYALEGLIGLLFWKRLDAQVRNAEAIVKQKVSAT